MYVDKNVCCDVFRGSNFVNGAPNKILRVLKINLASGAKNVISLLVSIVKIYNVCSTNIMNLIELHSSIPCNDTILSVKK